MPCNFFGAHGDFAPATAPLVNALIARAVAAAAVAAETTDGGTAGGAAAVPSPPPLRVMGTGKPLRQIMSAHDLARVLLWALGHYALPPTAAAAAAPAVAPLAPLIVAGPEHSVREIAEAVCAAAGFHGGLAFDEGAVDGPLRRTADTSAFAALCPDFAFSPLADSIRATMAWHAEAQKRAD